VVISKSMSDRSQTTSSLYASLRSIFTMATPVDPALATALPTEGALPPTHDTGSQPRPLKRRKLRPCHQPDRGSLYDIMYRHQGTSLYVRPIFWTDHHVRLLGARFTELEATTTPSPVTDLPGAHNTPPPPPPPSPPSDGHLRPSGEIRTIAQSLTQMLEPYEPTPATMNSVLAHRVLSILWPKAFTRTQIRPELAIHCGGKTYRDCIKAQLMWDFPMDTSSDTESFKSTSTQATNIFSTSQHSVPIPVVEEGPMMCYIGLDQLSTMRRNMFRVGPTRSGYMNTPVARLQELRSRMLCPSNAVQDPHIVAMFIAMAQRHFFGPNPRTAHREHKWYAPKGYSRNIEFRDLKLRVLSHDIEEVCFILYTATVKAEFLQRFHHPFTNPSGDNGEVPGLDIQYTKIPIWPILGLRERMGKALGHDVVGPFDPEDMKTWQRIRLVSGENSELRAKRKRDVLSAVLNQSFEDTEDEDDEPALGSKRRCLSEGPPLGVVN